MADMDGREGERHPTWIRDSIFDIPLQELRTMLGEHLLWQDRIQDELLSWTMSYLFATVHLYLRHLDGQEMGYISMINRTRAVHPKKWYLEQSDAQEHEPAMFYFANILCEIIRVLDHEWPCRRDQPGLHTRKINHELITEGAVEIPTDDPLQQAAWTDLVAAGLFDLVPELKVCSCSMVAGLYTVLRHIRTSNYNEIRRTSERDLVIAQNIAWLHTRLPPGKTRNEGRPNLWILLHTLTFHKRAPGDELFKELIRALGYTRKFSHLSYSSSVKTITCGATKTHNTSEKGVDSRD